MIQRVQTLYLLLATALMSLTLFLPLATILQGGNELIIKAFTLSGVEGVEGSLQIAFCVGKFIFFDAKFTQRHKAVCMVRHTFLYSHFYHQLYC